MDEEDKRVVAVMREIIADLRSGEILLSASAEQEFVDELNGDDMYTFSLTYSFVEAGE